jgi:hypothetical protein
MAADSKKVQTIVNIAARAAEDVREAIARLEAARTLFNAVNPDRTGTPLAGGNAAALSGAIDRLGTLVNDTDAAIWSALIAAKVPTHRGEAL